MAKKKKIGLFGGSFDPLHFGHINLAVRLLEKKGLDEILFCLAKVSPFKKDNPPIASPAHRLEMLKLIIESVPFFRITSIELERPSPSYMIDTLEALCENGDEYHLILANEHVKTFHLWKDYEKIVDLAAPFIGTRLTEEVSFSGSKDVGEKIKRGICQIPLLDISSTEIRERLSKGLYCGHLIPSKVLDYIYAHRLYSTP